MTVKADIIKAELLRIRKKYGKITREIVVKEARNKRNPLYGAFEWSDTAAAHKYRLEQAGELISSYITITTITKRTRIRVPIAVHDPMLPSGQPGYILTSENMQRERAIRVLDAEMDRIHGCIVRARNLAELLEEQHPGLMARLQSLLEGATALHEELMAAE